MKSQVVKNPVKVIGIANRMKVAGPSHQQALIQELLAAIYEDGEDESWKRPLTGAVGSLLSVVGDDRMAGIETLRNLLSIPVIQNNGSAVAAITRTLRVLREAK